MTVIVFLTRCDDLCQLTRLAGLLGLDGRRLRPFPTQHFPELVSAIRENLRVISSPRDGDVSQAAIDQLFVRLLSIHVDQDSICGRTLARMARYCIAVVEVPISRRV